MGWRFAALRQGGGGGEPEGPNRGLRDPIAKTAESRKRTKEKKSRFDLFIIIIS